MKENFTENNYTKSDVAKSVFERHWLRSTSVNHNRPAPTHYTLLGGSSMQGGGGMPYPGVSRVAYAPRTAEEKTES